MNVNPSEVEYVETQHWRYKDTEFILGYLASKCAECGKDIPDDHAGYIRDGPLANGGDGGLDELCFDCGGKVTGFGDT